MQRLEDSFAGHTIDSDTFLHEGVLHFDHRAAGQKTILVSPPRHRTRP